VAICGFPLPFSTSRLVQRAIEIVQKAIDEDVKQNYPEAYRQYQNSLDYFMLALKCTLQFIHISDLVNNIAFQMRRMTSQSY